MLLCTRRIRFCHVIQTSDYPNFPVMQGLISLYQVALKKTIRLFSADIHTIRKAETKCAIHGIIPPILFPLAIFAVLRYNRRHTEWRCLHGTNQTENRLFRHGKNQPDPSETRTACNACTAHTGAVQYRRLSPSRFSRA